MLGVEVLIAYYIYFLEIDSGTFSPKRVYYISSFLIIANVVVDFTELVVFLFFFAFRTKRISCGFDFVFLNITIISIYYNISL